LPAAAGSRSERGEGRHVKRFRFRAALALTSFLAASLGGACAAAAAVPATMLAGTAKADITPPNHGFPTMYLGGFNFRTLPATSVGRPLCVRALALRSTTATFVFVSLDVLTIPGSFHDAVIAGIASLHLPASDVLLQATHTHSGPVVGQQPNPFIMYDLSTPQQALSGRYTDWLAGTTAATIKKAVAAALQPVTLAYGVTHLPASEEFAVNRRAVGAPERFVDAGTSGSGLTDIPVLAVQGHAGLAAVLFGYAAHALIVAGTGAAARFEPGPLFYQYDSDFPGAAEAVLESDYPGATAFYVTGASGDLNPNPNVMEGADPALLPGTHIARAVEAALPSLKPIGPIVAAAADSASVPLDSYDLAYFKAIEGQNNPWGRQAKVMVADYEKNGGLPSAAPLALSVWHFAPAGTAGTPLYVIAMAGEPLVHWSLAFKRGALGIPGKTWLAGYVNDACCYVPSDSTVIYPGYESGWRQESGSEPGWIVSGSMLYYAWNSRLKPGSIDEAILPAIRSLVVNEVRLRRPANVRFGGHD